MKKTIIFDFDGTIVDSLALFTKIADKLSGGHAKIKAEEIASLRGLIKFGQRIHTPYWRMPFVLRKVRGLVARHISELKPFEGITELIQNLSSRGDTLFIVSTNTTRSIQKSLRLLELENYFSGVYGSKLIGNKTKSLHLLLSHKKLKPEDCIYIGDETRDIEAARAVGVPCIAVAWGFSNTDALRKLQPQGLANNPADIIPLIDKITAAESAS